MLIVGILKLRLGGGGTGPPGDPAKESELDEVVAGTPSQAITAGKPPPEAEVSGEDNDVIVMMMMITISARDQSSKGRRRI